MKVDAAPGSPGVLPLSLHVAPLSGFVEVHLRAGSPYRAIEVQRLDLSAGPSTIVVTHRPSGELDVLVPAGAGLDRTWFERDPFLAHMRFGSLTEVPFTVARCEVGDGGVDVEVGVDHPDGRRLDVRVLEAAPGPVRPRFAPTPAAQIDPMTLRFMLGSGLRRLTSGTDEVLVAVDGTALEPKRFPLPGLPSPWLAARSGAGIFGVGLNLAIEQTHPLDPGSAADPMLAGDEGRELVARRGSHELRFRLVGEAGSADAGRFEVDSSVGRVATGGWRIERYDDGLGLVLSDVAQRWFPGWRAFGQLPTYAFRRLRRHRETWTWSGRSTIDGDRVVHDGRWYVVRPNPA